ncbi:hypothetical protein JW835_00190 [bacterium]|nr:hypothetical protein [bacterium]
MRYKIMPLFPFCLWMIMGCAASHYSLGKKHLNNEAYAQALAEFELAKQENPNDPKVFREMGIAYYQQLDFKNAIQHLLQAFLQDSADGRTLFYLGTAFEITKQPDMAMDIYSRYVDVSPTSGIRSSIEGRLEKLMRQKTEDAVKKALADENQLDVNAIPDSTIAVLYFQNMGDNRDLDPIQKGLADMIITDLSKVKKLHVIERLQMQKLFEEMGLGMTGLVDEKTAPRVGKLLGASRLVKGGFVDLSGNKLRINASLIPVKSKVRYRTNREIDQLDNLFKMEKNLVFGLISRMGIQLTQEERDAIEIIPTENILAFMAYCNALDYEDRGMFEQSAEFYHEAVMLDPGFVRAQQGLTVSEKLSAGKMDVSQLEQQYVTSEVETETSESASAEGDTGEEAEGEEAAETVAEAPSANVVNQMIHSGGVLDQVFLPGVESREPAQERNASTFGSDATFDIHVDIPQD